MEEGAKEPQESGPYALTDHWKLLASAVDAALEAKLGELGDGCPERLRAAIGYSLLSPAKGFVLSCACSPAKLWALRIKSLFQVLVLWR